jgi:hypothetical protein
MESKHAKSSDRGAAVLGWLVALVAVAALAFLLGRFTTQEPKEPEEKIAEGVEEMGAQMESNLQEAGESAKAAMQNVGGEIGEKLEEAGEKLQEESEKASP